jgi:tetratricopeptide (TPR) repeat protein
MNELAAQVPSLELYRRFAHALASYQRNEPMAHAIAIAEREVQPRKPRSFIGWSTVMGFLAMSYARLGDAVRAEACCERALAETSAEDVEYVSLFLLVELQMAYAQAKLGKLDLAFARLDGLIARLGPARHPLTLGSLHEARASIALSAGRREIYEESLAEVERWFRATATPLLVARCERLATLGKGDIEPRQRPSLSDLPSTISATVVNEH